MADTDWNELLDGEIMQYVESLNFSMDCVFNACFGCDVVPLTEISFDDKLTLVNYLQTKWMQET